MRSTFVRVARRVTAASLAVSVLATAALVGCDSVQSPAQARAARPFDVDGTAEAYVAERTPDQLDTIRVHSIQRLASGDNDALTATVSVRNVGPTVRRVTVAVAWLSRSGTPIASEPVSRETIVLDPHETRQLTFVGGADARDFKVSLTYPGG